MEAESSGECCVGWKPPHSETCTRMHAKLEEVEARSPSFACFCRLPIDQERLADLKDQCGEQREREREDRARDGDGEEDRKPGISKVWRDRRQREK